MIQGRELLIPPKVRDLLSLWQEEKRYGTVELCFKAGVITQSWEHQSSLYEKDAISEEGLTV